MVKFWVGVVSENHVKRGVTGGFCQVCHEKRRLPTLLQS